MFLSKYGVARHIYIPIIKRAVVDFAVSADWTPAAGDVKISKDGGGAANVTNLPVAIAMGNGAIWDFSLTATEMQAAQVIVTVADSATKAVEDQSFIIETYGNASGQHAVDLADSVRAGLTALPNAAASAVGGLPVAVDASGRVDVLKINGTSQTAGDVVAGVAAIKVTTDKIVFTVANQVDVNVIDWKGAAAPAMTGDAFARLGAPAGASVSADIAAIKADTANIYGKVDTEVAAIISTLGTPVGVSVSADIATVASYIDTEVASLITSVGVGLGTAVAAVKAKTYNLPASPAAVSDIPTANANADALLDRTDAIETGWTLRKVLRLMASVLAGKVSGGATATNTFRSITDAKDRVTSTVDSDGNRTAVTLDGS